MLGWRDVLAHLEHYKDLQREAEEERRIRRLLAGRERRDRFQSRVLTGLGCRLVAWGCRLQERYGFTGTGGDALTRRPHPVSRCAVASCRQ